MLNTTPRKNLVPVDWANLEISKYNAQFLIESYAVVIAGLLSCIVEALPESGNYNVEFKNVAERLTPKKCSKLLYLDGPYRASETRTSVIEALMYYAMR